MDKRWYLKNVEWKKLKPNTSLFLRSSIKRQLCRQIKNVIKWRVAQLFCDTSLCGIYIYATIFSD
uniref:Uncharacterized protein n=1 Tax=Romanomermis culicivorax TaxID=13658 RepID=A0A915JUQ2_ROMCU